MNNTLLNLDFNDTIINLMCILIVYYFGLPLIKKLIHLIKELKKEEERRRNINNA